MLFGGAAQELPASSRFSDTSTGSVGLPPDQTRIKKLCLKRKKAPPAAEPSF
jgi:hypothetical protein